MKNSSRSQTLGLVTVIGIITAGVGVSALKSSRSAPPPIVLHDPAPQVSLSPPPSTQTAFPAKPAPIPSSASVEPAPASKPTPLVVHVTGAVKKPGVYHLPSDSRGEDAIKAAGGILQTANENALNLAAHLEDGSQIHVPTKKEMPPDAPPAPDALVKHDPTVAKTAFSAPHLSVRPASSAKPNPADHLSKSDKLTPDSRETINLNTAGAEELQRLPGIGPAMAERVLAYRKEAGGFKSPDEMLQVKGIGAKKFAKMERFLRVK